MKKFVAIVLFALFVILPVINIVQEFIANDTMHYFREQPSRLLLVAAIGIAGGLVAFMMCRLSSRRQRQIKLLTLGVTASFVTVTGGCFTILLAGLPPQIDLGISKIRMILTVVLCVVAVAGVLWFEFYQVFKKRLF
jgi:hypothetical protein